MRERSSAAKREAKVENRAAKAEKEAAEEKKGAEAATRAKTESEDSTVKKIDDLKRRFEALNQARIQAEAEKKAVETVGIRISLELYYFLAFALALQCREIRTQRGSLSVR